MEVVVHTSETRNCAMCRQDRPYSQFIFVMDGEKRQWGNTCSGCRNRIHETCKKAAKPDEQQEYDASAARVKEFIRQTRTNKIEAPHISEVAEQIMKRFGGLEQFSVEWKKVIDATVADPKSSGRTKLVAMGQVLETIKSSSQHRGSAPDMQEVTDEDLQHSIYQDNLRMLAENPEMIIDIIRQTNPALLEMMQKQFAPAGLPPPGDPDFEPYQDPANA